MALKLYHITTARRAPSIKKRGLKAPVFLSSWKYLQEWINSYLSDIVETGSRNRFLVIYRVFLKRSEVGRNKEAKMGEKTLTEYVSFKDIPPRKLKLVRRLEVPSFEEFREQYDVTPGRGKKKRRVRRSPRKTPLFGRRGFKWEFEAV